MKLLENKVCLVTGASRGIGRAIAQCMAEQGAAVAFTYLSSPEKAKALEGELAANGVKVKGYQSDASDFAAAEKLIADVLADFGKIDVVVNPSHFDQDPADDGKLCVIQPPKGQRRQRCWHDVGQQNHRAKKGFEGQAFVE